MMDIILEQISLFGAIIGSLLIALNIGISGWAFIPYMISNISTVYLLRKSNAPKVITYQSWWFVAINCVGIVRWLL
jgi:hypothetical protein